MLKDLKNAILTSRGMNLGRDQHSGVTRVQVPKGCTKGGPDPFVDTRPCSPLLVSIVYIST